MKSLFSAPVRIALGYLAFLTLAEVLTTLIEPRVGLVMHGLLLVALFVHASFWDHGRLRGFLLSLAMAPLIRLLSLSLPLPSFPFIYWYMVVGAPLLIAALVASQIGRINRRMLGLTLRKLPAQLLIALSGVILGYLEYRILRPDPLIPELRLELVWIPALILLIFTGFLEEYVFRGLMQYTSMRSFGRFGFYYVAIVFAVLHLGYHSALDVVFVFVVALFFGWAAQRTGSIFGVTFAHGLTNIGLFLIFPFVAVSLPSVPGLPSLFPAQTPAATQPAPGLLAPVATLEGTRPWVPPAPTQAPITPTIRVVTSTALTETATATSTPTLEATPVPGATETPVTPAASPTCAPRRDWVPYVVQPGDTLFGIAERAGLSLEGLMQANCYTSFKIYSGQVLYVPFRLAIPTSPPTPQATSTATDTPVPLPTALPTDTPTATGTPTDTPAPTATPTDTPVPADTSTPADTPVP